MTNADRHRRSTFGLIAVIVFMGAATWASVPLYDWFCRVTGYGGQPLTAESFDSEVLEQTVKVRFDASLERGMPWRFKPIEREIEVRLGEQVLAFYEAYNPTSMPIAGTASFNVYPFTAGAYFVKVDCFCFEEQVLQPGERVEMPVSFFVDTDILNDSEASAASTITLSYTFHRMELSEDELSDNRQAMAKTEQIELVRNN